MPSIVYAVIHAFLSLIIPSANIMVIVVLCQLKKKKPNRNYVFILNLAAADLLVGVMCIGEVLDDATDALFDNNLQLCLLRFCMTITPSIGSILTLLLVSLDRYLAVKLPLHYPILMSKKPIIFSLVVLWTVSFLVGHMPLIFSQLQQSNFTDGCGLLSVAKSDYLYIICFGIFIPALLTLIGLHISVGKIAYVQHKQIQRTHLHSDTPTTNLRHFKALRTVFIVILCFILFWGPYYVTAIVKATCASCSLHPQLRNFLYLLGETNSLINPFIYSLYSKDIRTQFARLLRCERKGQIKPCTCNELTVAYINVRIQSESMQQNSFGEQTSNTRLSNASPVCGSMFSVS